MCHPEPVEGPLSEVEAKAPGNLHGAFSYALKLTGVGRIKDAMTPTRRTAVIAAAIVFAVHVVANPHYGFFRDELYFIICGMHPQFGYVDQPPVIPLLAALTQVFGHSLLLLRAVPALFAAGGVYVTVMLAAELGGGAFAQILAAIAFLCSPVLLSFGMKVSTDEVGLWTWPLMMLLVVRLTKGADPRTWLLVGAVPGLSLESKYSVLFFLAALIIGVLLAPQRTILLNRWFAAGCGLAVLIAFPNFLWQAHYGFPMIELLRAGQNGKNEIVGPIVYLLQEILITGGLLALVWIAGLAWLFANARFRYLAFVYVLLIAMMIVLHGKHYYPANIYPALFAAGAAAIEAWTARVRALRPAVAALAVLFAIPLVPLSLPVLSETQFVAWVKAFHLPVAAGETEPGRDSGSLPGDWADMHGWENFAATVQRVYANLPPDQRARAVAKTSNYGEAAAVAFFAPDVPVISGHNQFYLWGTRGYSGDVLIDVHGDCGASLHLFRATRLAATIRDRWAIHYENNVPVMVCTGIKQPLQSIWPGVKDYE